MRGPLILPLLVAIMVPTFASAQQEVRMQEATEREPLRYLFYSPERDESAIEQTFPLVLFLHGGGEGGSDIKKVTKHGLPKLIAAGKKFPFYVVSPQNPSEKQFWDDQQLIRLVDEVVAHHPIDESRIYLTGLSRGGYGAWRLAIQNPNRFAALVPISGGGPVPYAKRIKHIPTWAFHGQQDSVIPVEESRRMIDALRKAGGKAMLTIYPNAQHDAWTQAYDDPDLYNWLLRHRLDAVQAE